MAFDAFICNAEDLPTKFTKEYKITGNILLSAVPKEKSMDEVQISEEGVLIGNNNYAYLSHNKYHNIPITRHVTHRMNASTWDIINKIAREGVSKNITQTMIDNTTKTLPFKNNQAAKRFIAEEVILSKEGGFMPVLYFMIMNLGHLALKDLGVEIEDAPLSRVRRITSI